MSLERLALRTIRALCLTGEASLHYFNHAGEDTKFNRKLPLLCADFAEHIAQDVLGELGEGGFSCSDRFVLESLLRALDWLKQFDRGELHRVTRSDVPTDSDLAVIRGDVEVALAKLGDA